MLRQFWANKIGLGRHQSRPLSSSKGNYVFKSIESYVGGVLVLLALLLFLSGMLFRLTSSTLSGDWVSEISIYLVAWGLLVSAAGCVAESEHIRADFFYLIYTYILIY